MAVDLLAVHRAAVRLAWGRATPFRLGASAALIGGLQNPYTPGKPAHQLFQDGYSWFLRTRNDKARDGRTRADQHREFYDKALAALYPQPQEKTPCTN